MLKCMTCQINEIEHKATSLCASCDRDEWRDATIGANKRFQYAEDQLSRIHTQAGRLIESMGHRYPVNYDDLWTMLEQINQGTLKPKTNQEK